MLATTFTLLGALAPQGPIGTSTAPVVINEFQYDDSGVDDREFVELYNRSGAPVDISNWSIGGQDPSGPNLAYPIPSGTILAPGAFYVIGPGNGLVPNVDLAVNGPGGGPTDLWENGQDSIELLDASGTIVDSVVYELHRGAIAGFTPEGEGFYGDFASLDTNPLSLGRLYDGYDTDDNARDFRMYAVSPGAANNTTLGGLPYVQNFDALGVSIPVAEMEHTFVPMTTIDPAVIDAFNLTVKPTSPQGGLAAVCWDSAGGGNTARLKHEPVENISIELYAWIEPAFTGTAMGAVPEDGEAWGFGVRGMTEWAGDPRDVPGDYGAIRGGTGAPIVDQPGHSGISWYYYRTDQYARVYLVDFNNSGDVNDFTILGSVDIVPGVNDGWQRMRLHVNSTRVHANFGGSYGQDDGVRIVADSPTTGIGGVWFNYREWLLDNSLIGALTIDALQIVESQATWGQIGSSCGGVGIDTDGLALLGSPNFAIKATNVPANSQFGGMVFGFQQATFPIAPSQCSGMVIPDTGFLAFGAPVAGEYVFPLPLPNLPAIAGIDVFFQCVAVPNGNIGQLRASPLQQANPSF